MKDLQRFHAVFSERHYSALIMLLTALNVIYSDIGCSESFYFQRQITAPSIDELVTQIQTKDNEIKRED